jgi:hypothetical protein
VRRERELRIKLCIDFFFTIFFPLFATSFADHYDDYMFLGVNNLAIIEKKITGIRSIRKQNCVNITEIITSLGHNVLLSQLHNVLIRFAHIRTLHHIFSPVQKLSLY